MSWFQKNFTLPSRSRGSYLITDHILGELPEIKNYKVGLLTLFVQHTSCALSLNENWDEDVRDDMSDALDRIVPADRKGTLYRHSAEGEDDMPVCFFFPYIFVESNSRFYSNRVLGTCQVSPHWRFGYYSHLQRSAGYRYLAGDLVFGVPHQ